MRLPHVLFNLLSTISLSLGILTRSLSGQLIFQKARRDN